MAGAKEDERNTAMPPASAKNFEKPMNFRTAIIVHVFYLDIWPEISSAIRNLLEAGGDAVVVFATFPNGRKEVADTIKKDLPSAHLIGVNNVGWDVWPFFVVLNRLNLQEWDLIVKLHTKRNVHSVWMNFRPFFRDDGWRKALLSFCSTLQAAKRSFSAFSVQPRLGMVAGERVIDPNGLGMNRAIDSCVALLPDKRLPSRPFVIVWGTMWMVRAHILKHFWRRWREYDFSSPDINNPHMDYGLAGDCEMLFGTLVSSQGYIVSSGRLPRWLANIHFVFKMFTFKVIRSISNILRKLTFLKTRSYISR